MKIKIGEYEYESVATDQPIEGFYIQEDGGDGKPIIRKKVEKDFSLSEMWVIGEKLGYYLMIHNLSDGLVPLTWTNNPEIREQHLHKTGILLKP